MKKNILSLSIVILGLIGFWGVSKISYLHFSGHESCPMLGMLPACYIVFLGYFMIVLSMLPRIPRSKMIFIIGWLPVIILALVGTAGEVTQTMSCPHTNTGIPKCYFSAVFSAAIGILAFFHFKTRKMV